MSAPAAPPKLPRLRVGTASFSLTSQHWAGAFFPPGARGKSDAALDFYQEQFDVCEVNGTAHRMPSEAQMESWRAHAASSFLLGLKVVATVTHCDNPGDEASLGAFRLFLDRASHLGPALGPLLLQFPQSVHADLRLLQSLAQVVEESKLPSKRIALEVRHASWLKPEFGLVDFLRQQRWALVQHPNSIGRSTVTAERRTGAAAEYELEPLDESHPVTADGWIYVRLHGRNDEHTYRYTDEELKVIAQVLHRWRQRGLEVFCFILNDDREAAMPHNARRLRQLVYQLAEEKEPRMPKQPRTMHDFFGSPSSKRQKA